MAVAAQTLGGAVNRARSRPLQPLKTCAADAESGSVPAWFSAHARGAAAGLREGDAGEAEFAAAEALAAAVAALGEGAPTAVRLRINLAALLWRQGRAALGAEHPDIAFCAEALAAILLDDGRTGEALALLRRAEAIHGGRGAGADAERLARLVASLGSV